MSERERKGGRERQPAGMATKRTASADRSGCMPIPFCHVSVVSWLRPLDWPGVRAWNSVHQRAECAPPTPPE